MVGNRVIIKSIAEAIGLNAESVGRGIKSHHILGAKHTVESVQIGENQRREYLTLPIEYVHGWLFSVDISKVKEEAKEKLMLYQEHCYHVLFEHFHGKNKKVEELEGKRFLLLNELRQIESQNMRNRKRKKQIMAELDEIDIQIGGQLGFDFQQIPEAND